MSYCWNYLFICQSFLRMCNRVPSSWSVQGADSLLVMRGGLFLIPSANCSTWVKTPRPLSKSLSWWQPIPHFHPVVPPFVVLLFPSCCPLVALWSWYRSWSHTLLTSTGRNVSADNSKLLPFILILVTMAIVYGFFLSGCPSENQALPIWLSCKKKKNVAKYKQRMTNMLPVDL